MTGRAKLETYVRTETAPVTPPPPSSVGIVGWIRANLFSDWVNSILTVLCLVIIYITLSAVIDWAFVRAVWTGEDNKACLDKEVGFHVGACWAFVGSKFHQFVYGLYPIDERWRVDIVFASGAVGIVWLIIENAPYRKWVSVFLLTAYPVMSLILLTGGNFGLVPVETNLWGGLLVTLVVAVTGIVASLPIGILLALGRRSTMPVVRMASIIFIEFWRGVPLITVLFMSSVMFPLFMPEGVNFDKLLRCLIGVALFSAAYMAEVVRGGLQAVPRGQYEGAQALGLTYWKMIGLIVMPQALKFVIPGIVNSFISLFKDTTLVLIIGLFDLLGIIKLSTVADAKWFTPSTAMSGYAFAAIVFWGFCFAMSRYSIFMENKLHTGTRGN